MKGVSESALDGADRRYQRLSGHLAAEEPADASALILAAKNVEVDALKIEQLEKVIDPVLDGLGHAAELARESGARERRTDGLGAPADPGDPGTGLLQAIACGDASTSPLCRAMPRSHPLVGFRRPPLSGASLASYRRERVRDTLFPVGVALMEGSFVGVLAGQLYAAGPAVLALCTAAPMAGNLSSLVWARLAEGRAKIPFLSGLQLAVAAFVAAMALLPRDAWGVDLLAIQMVGARLLLGGVVTLRSLVWTHNYPRASRARVTSRLSFLTIASMTLTSLLGGLALGAHPDAFRLVYAAGALAACIGTGVFAKLRILAPHEVAQPESPQPPEPPRRSASNGGGGHRSGATNALGLLRSDPLYTRYLLWQFVLGVSNMLTEAPVLWLVSRELQAGATLGVVILQALPLAGSALSLPFWGPYLDRVHVAHFRARTGWLWVAAQLLVWGGAWLGSLGVVALGRCCFGLARGGGLVAWQIGHNDFASPERAHLYMGVHVALTGLRGLVAPFVGMFLFVGAAGFSGSFSDPGSGLSSLGAFDGMGRDLFLLSAGLATASTLGFASLARRLHSSETVAPR